MINNLGKVFLIVAVNNFLTIVAADTTYNRLTVFSSYYRFLNTGKWELSDEDHNSPFDKKRSISESLGVACGVPTIQPYSSRADATIINGNAAKPGSWPYVVQLRHYGLHTCGGSILNKQWIVTAAHCFEKEDLSNWEAQLGRYNKYGNEKTKVVVRNIEEFFIHENFNRDTFDSDIALLKLQKPIQFTRYIRPICLPTVQPPIGAKCKAVGWGATKGTGSPFVLNQVDLPIISPDTCNNSLYYNGEITSNMTCAGYEQGGKDACQGDSGGPLMNKVNGAWQLAGIVSWGEGCAIPRKPGVYTNVYKYINWIKKHMKNS